jgi:site-specific DNA-methyltransferase (adenine-specific)
VSAPQSPLYIRGPHAAGRATATFRWFLSLLAGLARPKHEKLYGRHPTQKPLRLVRRALLASTRGELVFDPFCGSGPTGVATKELGRFFVGGELEEEFC